VVVVGDFPFTERLGQKVGRLHLFELRERPDRTPRAEWEETLQRCQVVAITSTALLTRQMSYFLTQARQAFKILLGPSTPLSPALFDCGADALAASLVAETGPVMDGVREGLPYHNLKRLGIDFVLWQRPQADKG